MNTKIKKFNEFAGNGPEEITGSFPYDPFGDIKDGDITIRENEKFSFSNVDTYNIFVKKDQDYRDVRAKVNEFANNVFGSGTKCKVLSDGDYRMEKEMGLDWCEFYTLLLANLWTNEAAKAEVFYVLGYFAFAK